MAGSGGFKMTQTLVTKPAPLQFEREMGHFWTASEYGVQMCSTLKKNKYYYSKSCHPVRSLWTSKGKFTLSWRTRKQHNWHHSKLLPPRNVPIICGFGLGYNQCLAKPNCNDLFSTKLYRALAWNTIDAAGIAGQGHPGILPTVFKHIMVLHLLDSIIYSQAADFFGWCWQHLGATLCFSRLRSRLVQHQFAAILIWERSERLQTAPKFIWAAPGWWQNPKDPEPRLTTGKFTTNIRVGRVTCFVTCDNHT